MLRKLFADYLTRLEASTSQSGLGITAILGRPETGRGDPQLPVAALTFSQESDLLILGTGRTLRRLGDTPAQGRTITVNLYLYANGEPELFDLLDSLSVTRKNITGLTVSETPWAIRYDTVERIPESEDPLDKFAVVVPVSFSANP